MAETTDEGSAAADRDTCGSADAAGAGARVLSPEAQRALAEAEARRKAAVDAAAQAVRDGNAPAREVGGRSGPDPVRYGDWEKGGIVSDF